MQVAKKPSDNGPAKDQKRCVPQRLFRLCGEKTTADSRHPLNFLLRKTAPLP